MITLTLQREKFQPTYTRGELFQGLKKLCDTIERPWKNNIKRASCIPAGVYTCVAFDSPSNGDVWLLKDVPNRDMIQIHSANLAEELLGCIAVGQKGYLKGKPAVLKSKLTMEYLKDTLPSGFILIVKDAI